MHHFDNYTRSLWILVKHTSDSLLVSYLYKKYTRNTKVPAEGPRLVSLLYENHSSPAAASLNVQI